MESPLRGVRFIHKALQHEARAIDQAARDPASDPAALVGRVAFFHRISKIHHASEEGSIFPDLEARRPGIAATFLVDHAEDVPLLEEITRLAKSGARQELAQKTAILKDTLRIHVKKEEEILVPLAESIFTPAEQVAQVGKMMSAFPAQDMKEIMPWLVGALELDDRVAYVGMVKHAMPPDRFEVVAGWLKESLGADAWSAIVGRL
jgi:hemerythrin-like domain-containing protein